MCRQSDRLSNDHLSTQPIAFGLSQPISNPNPAHCFAWRNGCAGSTGLLPAGRGPGAASREVVNPSTRLPVPMILTRVDFAERSAGDSVAGRTACPCCPFRSGRDVIADRFLWKRAILETPLEELPASGWRSPGPHAGTHLSCAPHSARLPLPASTERLYLLYAL
jgi:hypothetical protein